MPAFPRARYYAPRGEWEHAHERHPRDSVSYIDANYDPLVESGRMVLVDGDCEVVPGIWMRRAPGHNRDLCVITAESGGKDGSAFFPTWCPRRRTSGPPGWRRSICIPLEAIETKTRWLTARHRRRMDLRLRARRPALPFARIRPTPKRVSRRSLRSVEFDALACATLKAWQL